MAVWITPDDLAPFATIDAAKAAAMIEDATAMALMAAPCLADLPADSPKLGALRAILRGALLRWDEAGSGALASKTANAIGFSYSEQTDTRQKRSGLFFPSEIEQLQSLCGSSAVRSAFSIDTVGGGAGVHAPWCALVFGAGYCSCGSDINRYEAPLYEGGILGDGSAL